MLKPDNALNRLSLKIAFTIYIFFLKLLYFSYIIHVSTDETKPCMHSQIKRLDFIKILSDLWLGRMSEYASTYVGLGSVGREHPWHNELSFGCLSICGQCKVIFSVGTAWLWPRRACPSKLCFFGVAQLVFPWSNLVELKLELPFRVDGVMTIYEGELRTSLLLPVFIDKTNIVLLRLLVLFLWLYMLTGSVFFVSMVNLI